MALIERKAEGKEIVAADTEAPKATKAPDLMAALEESIAAVADKKGGAAKGKAKASRAKKSAAKPKKASKKSTSNGSGSSKKSPKKRAKAKAK